MLSAVAPALVEALARWCAPWQSLFSDSKVVSTAVVTVHVVALLFGGGLAVAADRATLRAARGGPGGRAPHDPARRDHLLADLGDVHRPVIVALALANLSGVLLAAADVKTYAASPVFWVKLALVMLLLANGLVLARAESALRRGGGGAEPGAAAHWRRLRATSWASLALWTLTTVAGTVLTAAA